MDTGRAWAQLPSKPERVVAAMFSASVTVQVGDGTTARFWTDSWLPDGAICAFAPNLFRAVGWRHRNRTIRDAMLNQSMAPCSLASERTSTERSCLHTQKLAPVGLAAQVQHGSIQKGTKQPITSACGLRNEASGVAAWDVRVD